MDLSGLVAAAKAGPPPAGASYVLEIDDSSFEAVLARSSRFPVVLELHSVRAGAEELSADLAELTNEAGGAFLLARVDVDRFPQIAAALGINAVPTLIGVVGGKLVPLFQGTRSREEIRAILGQLLQVAATQGVVGRSDPVSIDAQTGPDPRFAAADQALASGDFQTAIAEFDKLLAASPNDAEAKAGRAQASLLARFTGADPAQVIELAAAEPQSVEAQLAAADVELVGGSPEAAFTRLLDLLRALPSPQREPVRLRLLELFETVGAQDPAVLRARRELMSALF